jgi:hypothetical protein
MKNDISFPGSPALWAGSFTFYEIIILASPEYTLIARKKSFGCTGARCSQKGTLE